MNVITVVDRRCPVAVAFTRVARLRLIYVGRYALNGRYVVIYVDCSRYGCWITHAVTR